ncbi:hypothetical protein MVES_002884 [Malassezia vespertilionis]|uniref:Uncharacterized protein n=2 Tax=Malassezia vespertilionis TaxID=2020962 RepID=A0A2N1J9B4_9BASI|nr:hypothetical protein MVES_002884 [Malassezia vespertilionis]
MALRTTTKRKTITKRKTVTMRKTVTETSDTHQKTPATSKTKDATVHTTPSTTRPWALPTVHETSDTDAVHSKHKTRKSDSVSLVSPVPVTTKDHALPSTAPHQASSIMPSKHETHKGETTSPSASHAFSAKNEHTHTSLFLHSPDKTQDHDTEMQRHTNSATRDAPTTIPSHHTVHASHGPAHHAKGAMRRSRGSHVHAHGKESRSTALSKDVGTSTDQSATVSSSTSTASTDQSATVSSSTSTASTDQSATVSVSTSTASTDQSATVSVSTSTASTDQSATVSVSTSTASTDQSATVSVSTSTASTDQSATVSVSTSTASTDQSATVSVSTSTTSTTTSTSTTTTTSAYVFVKTDALVMPTPSGPLLLPIYDANKTKQKALPQMITPTSNDGVQLSQSVRISILFKSTVPWSWVVHQRDTAAQLFTYMPPMLAAGMQSSTDFVHTIQLRSQKMTSSDTSPRTLHMARIPPSNVGALQKAFHRASTAMLANTSSHVQRELAEQIDTSFDLLTYKDRDPNGNPPPTLSPSATAAIAATFSTVGFLMLVAVLGWFGYRWYKRRAQTAQDKRRDTIASFVGISPPNCTDEPQQLSTPSPTWTYGDGRTSTMNSRGSATPYMASHPGRIQLDTPRAERALGWSVPDTSGDTVPYLGAGMSLGSQQADIFGFSTHPAPMQGEVGAPVRRYYPDVPPNIPLWLAQERMAATLAQGLPDAGSLPLPPIAQLPKSPMPKELEQATF